MMSEKITLHLGDCLEVIKALPDASIDAIVTDPPYGLSFMGKRWDYDVPSVDIWVECLRVLKAGGHLLAFAGTRTQHRMAVRIEDAGFDIRDMIAWVYGSGFPKSLDVSKAIDKDAGHWRGRAGSVTSDNGAMSGGNYERTPKGAPVTEAARQWQGWGTALKPALEPITVARKPFKGTVAENVLAHGTGALNIDGCRVTTDEVITNHGESGRSVASSFSLGARVPMQTEGQTLGRWPANLIHDGSPEVLAGFPDTGSMGHNPRTANSGGIWGNGKNPKLSGDSNNGFGDTGSAARFFYCPKASKRDRDEGLDGFDKKARPTMGNGIGEQPNQQKENNCNIHPTVKPTDLMRYLCRLVTPPNGVVLDPFMGSGSTGKAAMLEGFRFIGIERDASYMEIARARIESAAEKKSEVLI